MRERVNFHVDRRTLEDESAPWIEADITGNELIFLSESAHEVLRRMLLDLTGEDRSVPDYYGEDIEKIIRAYRDACPNSPLSI